MQGLPSLVKGAGLRTLSVSRFVSSNLTPCTSFVVKSTDGIHGCQESRGNHQEWFVLCWCKT